MKERAKIAVIIIGIVIGIMIYSSGYFGGRESVTKGIQLESIGDSIRFVFEDDAEGIWKPTYHNDGSFIGFTIYEINGDFKTFVHINETIKAKIN